MLNRSGIGLCLAIAWIAGAAAAEIPERINYQGRLLNGTNLVNDLVEVIFQIYPSESGGSPLYSETQTVEVVDGYYSTQIGLSNSMPGCLSSVLTNSPLFLEISINGMSLQPRESLTAAAFALQGPGITRETADSLYEPHSQCAWIRHPNGGITYYTNLLSALSQLVSGDVLNIGPGRHVIGNTVINRDNIVVQGAGKPAMYDVTNRILVGGTILVGNIHIGRFGHTYRDFGMEIPNYDGLLFNGDVDTDGSLTMQNLTLAMARTNYSHGILAQGKNIVVEGVDVYGGAHGIVLRSRHASVSHVRAFDCDVSGLNIAGTLITKPVYDVNISDVQFYSSGTNLAGGLTIRTGGAGGGLNTISDVNIVNLYAGNNVETAVYLDSYYGPPYTLGLVKNINVVNAVAEGSAKSAYMADGAINVAFVNCIAQNAHQDGFFIRNSTNVTLLGCRAFGSAALDLDSQSSTYLTKDFNGSLNATNFVSAAQYNPWVQVNLADFDSSIATYGECGLGLTYNPKGWKFPDNSDSEVIDYSGTTPWVEGRSNLVVKALFAVPPNRSGAYRLQYSTGTNWVNLPSVAGSSALLLTELMVTNVFVNAASFPGMPYPSLGFKRLGNDPLDTATNHIYLINLNIRPAP